MPLFCRHNRFEHSCPICSREKQAQRRSAAGPARPRRDGPSAGGPVARRSTGGLVTRKLARAADDGYRHQLVPGLKATEDAERFAACLALGAERLEFPGPHPAVAEEDDAEQATWLAFLLALAGPERPAVQEAIASARPPYEDAGLDTAPLGPGADRTIAAYRAWAERAGSQAAAFAGEPSWSAQRRFARLFDRLALPGFNRAGRYELLVTLGAAGTYDLEADALHVGVGGDDATTLAAKRALNSGDTMLLERRAAALADALGVPVAALDRGLALWDSPEPVKAPAGKRADRIRHALALT